MGIEEEITRSHLILKNEIFSRGAKCACVGGGGLCGWSSRQGSSLQGSVPGKYDIVLWKSTVCRITGRVSLRLER